VKRFERPSSLMVLGAVLAIVGLAIVLAMRPSDSGPAIEAFVLFIGALGLVYLSRATFRTFRAATKSPIEALIARPRPKQERLPELVRMERELEMATQSAFDTHYRLRPLLRELAETRLARRGIELDRPGSRAKELLGPELWEIVRPDLERPAEHHDPGVRLATVDRAVAALEHLS
jgi:hypothetical protein